MYLEVGNSWVLGPVLRHQFHFFQSLTSSEILCSCTGQCVVLCFFCVCFTFVLHGLLISIISFISHQPSNFRSPSCPAIWARTIAWLVWNWYRCSLLEICFCSWKIMGNHGIWSSQLIFLSVFFCWVFCMGGRQIQNPCWPFQHGSFLVDNHPVSWQFCFCMFLFVSCFFFYMCPCFLKIKQCVAGFWNMYIYI